ncbi:GvpL/GvpF family gas vesicle protein [Streptomyces sp. NPDC058653]|uniref:GvpL/GvpF family gas vesicle protein n=1 Tax=Streptomyces sp. NPDC058653 TaxID=3346576 RepID=UPI00365F3885
MNPVTEASPMVYLYAVGRAGTPLDTGFAGRGGIGDGPLRTVRAGELVALVSSVPYDSFGADALKARMEDLAELEVLARTHHSVVEAAYEQATVLPMRLATVYLDDARVTAMLNERGEEFHALLSRLEDHVELGVKVYADPRAAVVPAEPEQEPEMSPGRVYLRRRQTQRRGHRDSYAAAGAVAAEIPARVAGLVGGRVAHRPQQGDLAQGQGAGENIANEAYLVPAARVADFRAALAGLGEETPGVRVEITGPWAPYSFATPPRSAGGDGTDGVPR